MRTGLAVSVIGHLLVLVWGVVTLHSFAPLDQSIEAPPVDFIEIEEVSSIPEGAKTAEVSPEPSPNDPVETPAEKPDAVPVPQIKPEATPPPPPPPAPSTKPEPAPAAVAEPEPLPDPEPVSAPAETAPDEPLPEPKPEAEAKPEPAQVAVAVPSPRVRPKSAAPATPASVPTPSSPETSSFSADEIQALLDRNEPATAPEPTITGAAFGVPEGNASNKLTQSELGALKAQVEACWIIPTGWTSPREVTVTIFFRLNRDGTVNGNPEVVEYPPSQFGQVSADNAIRAILRCGPYELPGEKYEQWSEVQLRFSPPDPG